jgi:hypothetical protein
MTNWKLIASKKGIRPLAALPDGLVCYSKGSLYHVNYDLNDRSFICKLPTNGLIGYLGNHFRLIDRIFRLGPSHAMVLDGVMFIARRSEIWRCELSTGQLTLDFIIPDGRHSLSFGKLILPNGDAQICFGDYFSNPSRKPVRIWVRSNKIPYWSVRYEFADGEIEHVHAVTAIGKNVFVLCGDFDHCASIWVGNHNFSNIKCLLRGQQSYRATWITELSGKFIYATDTQLESNNIIEMEINEDNVTTRKLTGTIGSSIYNGSGLCHNFFSTTVECGMPTGNFIRDVFEMKRGPGIASNFAKIFCFDENLYFKEIFEAEKDFYPFRLAQFGSFKFPSGVMPKNTLVAYGLAVKNFDDKCMVFKLI